MAVEITAPPDERRGETHQRIFTIKDGDQLVFDPKRGVYQRGTGEKIFPKAVWGYPIQLRIGETSLEIITRIVVNAEGALITVDGNGLCGTQIRIANGSPVLHTFGGVDIQATHALVK